MLDRAPGVFNHYSFLHLLARGDGGFYPALRAGRTNSVNSAAVRDQAISGRASAVRRMKCVGTCAKPALTPGIKDGKCTAAAAGVYPPPGWMLA